jgi:dinuclear metal center YbgI/SA1388 family protein
MMCDGGGTQAEGTAIDFAQAPLTLMPMPVLRQTLIRDLDSLLASRRFRDYGPNGLQVEGRSEISCLATAATASLAACRAAVAGGADALLVHHGLLWGSCEPITGMLRQRLGTLLAGECSLVAYHLPLDAHPEVGNNAVALQMLGAAIVSPFAEHKGSDIGLIGDLPAALAPEACTELLTRTFAHPVMYCPGDGRPIRRIGVVTGGGQDHLTDAATAGCDALITGEASEQSWHEAAETGCALFACGHHATENHAVHALGARLATQHGLRHLRLDLANPI